jgi:hypothetical protein
MKSGTVPAPRLAWRRVPLLALGLVALLAGIYGGLARLPLNLPLPADNANWLTFHGPLMVCGFLGTVIGLERAVGLPNVWAYAAPLLTGLGAVTLVAGVPGRTGPVLLTLGSAVFVAVTWRVVQLQRALFTVTMSLGAACWLAGNVLWLGDWPFARIVPWWIAFLGLTIVGERLDLSRFQKTEPVARPLFLGSLGILLAGVVLGAFVQRGGERLMGLGLAALALWLARFDIARRTVRQPGLPRFMAVCLLSGYGWLATAGVLIMAADPLQSGTTYDAALHAFFLGFVFAMIFGHAPVIFPSVLNRPVAYRGRFYAHLTLLHVSLLLRVAGDLAAWAPGRQWGVMLNTAALVVFLLNTVTAIAFAGRRPGAAPARG